MNKKLYTLLSALSLCLMANMHASEQPKGAFSEEPYRRIRRKKPRPLLTAPEPDDYYKGDVSDGDDSYDDNERPNPRRTITPPVRRSTPPGNRLSPRHNGSFVWPQGKHVCPRPERLI